MAYPGPLTCKNGRSAGEGDTVDVFRRSRSPSQPWMAFGLPLPSVAAARDLLARLECVAVLAHTDDLARIQHGSAALAVVGQSGWMMKLLYLASATWVSEDAASIALAYLGFDLGRHVAAAAAAVVVPRHRLTSLLPLGSWGSAARRGPGRRRSSPSSLAALPPLEAAWRRAAEAWWISRFATRRRPARASGRRR